MYRTVLCALLLATALVFTGCATTGSSDSSSSSSTSADSGSAPAREYYHEEFSDVSIPIDMDVISGETFITYSPGGMKVGIQEFKGRVDMTSLVGTMQRYMQRDGWTLRSVFRAKRAILVFEKPEKICSLAITDGLIYTNMIVFISPKLAEGDARNSSPAYTPAATPRSSGASGGVQKLSQ